MIWYHFVILAGTMALVSFLIVHFFLRISNDYTDIERRFKYPSCESCSDSYCGCGLGDNNEKNRKVGRREPVSGEDNLPEAGQKRIMKKMSFEINGRWIEGDVVRIDDKFITIKLHHDYFCKNEFWEAGEEKTFSIKNCKNIETHERN